MPPSRRAAHFIAFGSASLEACLQTINNTVRSTALQALAVCFQNSDGSSSIDADLWPGSSRLAAQALDAIFFIRWTAWAAADDSVGARALCLLPLLLPHTDEAQRVRVLTFLATMCTKSSGGAHPLSPCMLWAMAQLLRMPAMHGDISSSEQDQLVSVVTTLLDQSQRHSLVYPEVLGTLRFFAIRTVHRRLLSRCCDEVHRKAFSAFSKGKTLEVNAVEDAEGAAGAEKLARAARIRLRSSYADEPRMEPPAKRSRRGSTAPDLVGAMSDTLGALEQLPRSSWASMREDLLALHGRLFSLINN